MHAWPATRELADASRRAYQHEVRRLVTWCEHRNVTSSRDLDCDAMQGFFSDVASEKPSAMARIGSTTPLSLGSITQARRIVSLLVHDAVSDGLLMPGLLRVTRVKPARTSAPKASRRTKRPSHQALGKLLFHPITSPTAELAVHFAFWCGLSVGEMALLRWRHLRRVGASMFVRIAGARLLVVPKQLAERIRKIQTSWRPQPGHFVFSNANGATRPVSTRTIARWIREAAHSRGCAELANASSLRQAFVVAARDSGWKESEILFRFRRQRISKPPLIREPGAAEANLLALEARLRSERHD